MAIENLTSFTIPQISGLTTIFQALGGLALAYLIYLVVSLILDIKKNKELKRIRELLEGISSKLGKKK